MMIVRSAAVLAIIAGLTIPAIAGSGQDAVLAEYKKAALAADSAFTGFSAEKGKAFFLADHVGGKPDTPSCTSCHTKSPLNAGQTRAGKTIDPMAVSLSPKRFTEMAKTEKWFARNCSSVLRRECTPQEKGDFITYMSGL